MKFSDFEIFYVKTWSLYGFGYNYGSIVVFS